MNHFESWDMLSRFEARLELLLKHNIMSAFGNYKKDEVYTSIKEFVEDLKLNNPEVQINEIIKEVMEAVTLGLENSIYNIENKKL